MRKTAGLAASIALLAGSVAPQAALAQDARRGSDDKKDDAAAAAVGLAILRAGIAIASKHGKKRKHDQDWDTSYYGEPFSPSYGVTCLPQQRKCYEGGHFSYRWTKRIFGTSAGFGGSGGSWEGGFGGWGSSYDPDRARSVCRDRGERKGLRNIFIESVTPHPEKNRIDVIMQSRRSQMTVSFERWRCKFYYNNSTTSIERI